MFFFRYLSCLILWHLRTRNRFLKLQITPPVANRCLKASGTNVSSQCSKKATRVLARAYRQPNARGSAKYRSHFPYFFSSTLGPMPGISFSHHVNWQKPASFALFICLAETDCSVCWAMWQNWWLLLFFAFSIMHCVGNWSIKKVDRRSLFWWCIFMNFAAKWHL